MERLTRDAFARDDAHELHRFLYAFADKPPIHGIRSEVAEHHPDLHHKPIRPERRRSPHVCRDEIKRARKRHQCV